MIRGDERRMHDIEFLMEVMSRPAMAKMVKNCRDIAHENPGACYVLNNKSGVQVRIGGGKRTWVSMRSILWLHEKGGDEAPVFGQPTCGTTGCINPEHQRLADPVSRHRPAVRVVSHHAAE